MRRADLERTEEAENFEALCNNYEARIKELEAALSTAEADKAALMEALKPFAKLGAEPPRPGFIYRDVHISYLREAAELMDRLRSEAEGKGTP